MMSQQIQVRRDTIKTVNFRGKLLDEATGSGIVHRGGMDTIGSYIDDAGHKQFVVVSSGDTFSLQYIAPVKIDEAQLQADIEALKAMERIEAIKPCDTSLLQRGTNASAYTLAHPVSHAAPQDKGIDTEFTTMLFIFMLPLSVIMLTKAMLATAQMWREIMKVARS